MALFLVVCGTYERNLYGFEVHRTVADEEPKVGQEKEQLELRPVFIYPSHGGCIKSLGLGGKYLASGSTDEVIKLYDVEKRVELGSLLQHTGSITAIAFHEATHMLSCSEDGTVCIWRTSDWECLKVLKGHKGPVHSVAIHPSGKLALSVGKDKTLKMWNLLKGRIGFTTNLSKPAELVAWSPEGTRYGFLADTLVKIFDAAKTEEIRTIESKRRINTFVFYKEDYVILGNEDSLVSVVRISDGKKVVEFAGHTNRIRGLSVVRAASVKDGKAETDWLVSISSDGFIRLWDLGGALTQTREETVSRECSGSYNADARFTCLAAQHIGAPGHQSKGKKPLVVLSEDADLEEGAEKGEQSHSTKKRKQPEQEKDEQQPEQKKQKKDNGPKQQQPPKPQQQQKEKKSQQQQQQKKPQQQQQQKKKTK